MVIFVNLWATLLAKIFEGDFLAFVHHPSYTMRTTFHPVVGYLWMRRWLISPILARNVRWQWGQVTGTLLWGLAALAFLAWRFCSAAAVLFSSNSCAPRWMQERHLPRSKATDSQSQASGSMSNDFSAVFWHLPTTWMGDADSYFWNIAFSFHKHDIWGDWLRDGPRSSDKCRRWRAIGLC